MGYNEDKRIDQLNERTVSDTSHSVILDSGNMAVRMKIENFAKLIDNYSSFKKSNIFSDSSGQIASGIRGGYSLEKMVFIKKVSDSANVAGGIDAAGTQLFPAREISNTITVIDVGEMFDISAAKSVYIHGTWHGSVSMSVYGVLKRIIH